MIKAALACLLGKQLQGRLQPEGKPDRENITAPDWAVSSRINSHPGFKEVFFFFFQLNFHQQLELTPHHHRQRSLYKQNFLVCHIQESQSLDPSLPLLHIRTLSA